jgi:hypothetical protein
MREPIVAKDTARSFRRDTQGRPIMVDVRSRSSTATVTDIESGSTRTAPFLSRRGARFGYVLEKGSGLAVDQPQSISQLPPGYKYNAPTLKQSLG